MFDALQRALGTNLSIENDVNVATVGEQLHGLGKGVANFVFLHVGTGVGLGLVVNGELFRGATGAAGEVGHLPFGSSSASPEEARRRGALEATVGGVGVVAEARRLGMRSPLNARRVFAAARRGDAVAQRVVGVEAMRIAFTIAAIAPVVDPELVVLGGGIGRNGDLLLDPVERELHSLSTLAVILRVVFGAVGDEAAELRSAQDRLFARASGRGEIVV